MITKEIRNKVEEKLGVDLNLRSETGRHKRDRDQVYARATYYALCKALTKLSLAAIGETLEQDHATVLYSITKIYSNLVLWNEERYVNVFDEVYEDMKPHCVGESKKKYGYKTYFDLVKENEDMKALLDSALNEINNEKSYMQKYIQAKIQLGYLKSAITKTKSLYKAEAYIREIENIKEG